MAWRHVTDGQWAKIAATLPPPKAKPKGGRPPRADRQWFEGRRGVLWTGAPWSAWPRRDGAKSAGHRRNAADPLARLRDGAGRSGHEPLGRARQRWDGRGRQQRGAGVGPTTRGKGTTLLVLAEGQGTPRGVPVEAASPAEVTRLAPTVESVPKAAGPPERLLAERGYASKPVRAWLAARGSDPLMPARSNNTVATHQAGRERRRDKRRWLIERRSAWWQHFRRLVVRYEYLAVNFIAVAHLACVVIPLKRV